MNDKLMVFMVTQERMGSPKSVATYFASITYQIKKHYQSIALYHSHFCLVMQWEGALRDSTKRLHGGTNSLRAQQIIVTSRKMPPHEGAREALSDKNKELLHKSA